MWVENHTRQEAMLGQFTAGLLAAAAIKPNDAVVDVGCGCGETTLQAASTAKRVVGVDLSPLMLERARQLAAAQGADNVAFIHTPRSIHFPMPAWRSAGSG